MIQAEIPVEAVSGASVKWLRNALKPLAANDLRIEYESPTATRIPIVSGPDGSQLASFPLETPPGASIHLFGDPSRAPINQLARTAIQAVLDRMELEKREEQLLDELGANWESLEALFEISTDLFRFGDVKNALTGLVNRFTSLQKGVCAALYVSSGERLQLVASNQPCPAVLDWKDLGALETALRENRATVIDAFPDEAVASSAVPWERAAQLAAAPLSAQEQAVAGCLIAWRENHRFAFDAPFSRLLEAMAYQAGMLLESDNLRRTMRENERLEQEIEIASSIQQTLLRGIPPRNVPQIEIASFSAASQRIDGDFHDFFARGHAVDVLIGDVMGKGVAAALLGAATKNQFFRAVADLSIDQGTAPLPCDIVERVASRLEERLIHLEHFVTLCYARLDPVNARLDLVDCGHTGILVHRKRTGETYFLRGDDLPMGIATGQKLTQRSAALLRGDTCLFFSDGLTETRNGMGEYLGEEPLIEGLETWSSLGPDILVKQLRTVAEQFREDVPQSDDLTIIAVRVGGATSTALAESEAAFPSSLDTLSACRNWVSQAGRTAGLDEERQARLELACNEVFVNCVAHGTNLAGSQPVQLRVATYPDRFTLQVSHQGPVFDPFRVPEPSFDGSRESGFGTFIIMRSADELAYERHGEINEIFMSFFRNQ